MTTLRKAFLLVLCTVPQVRTSTCSVVNCTRCNQILKTSQVSFASTFTSNDFYLLEQNCHKLVSTRNCCDRFYGSGNSLVPVVDTKPTAGETVDESQGKVYTSRLVVIGFLVIFLIVTLAYYTQTRKIKNGMISYYSK